MRRVRPIAVTHLFPEILEGLLSLLSGLSPEEWARPTVCLPWSVKDVASHLLRVDLSVLSRKRDGYSYSDKAIETCEELVALLNRLNEEWVKVARQLSPRVLCDLLRFAGMQVCEYCEAVDPKALGGPVSWAGPDPAPVWLDLAREYTERWHHQQHIRDAVGKPGFKQPRFLAPVLDTFVRALPYTYGDVDAEDGTLVALTITGPSGGRWFLLRQEGLWNLHLDNPQPPHAEVSIGEETAWRLYTRGISIDQARAEATFAGNRQLGLKALAMVSIIA
jgi:uncharacterized protein (TIGR03083 family)